MNQKLLELLGNDPDKYPAVLEQKFPHIFEKILALWGKAKLDWYLESLMVADRPDRQGFPPEAAMEIFRLSVIHGELDLAKQKKAGAWEGLTDVDKFGDKNK